MGHRNSASVRGYWRRQIELFRASGLSRREFAQQNQQSVWKLTYWDRKIASLSPPPEPAKLIPVKIEPVQRQNGQVRFCLPNGVGIECEVGTDIKWLGSLVAECGRTRDA